ncbi:ubiquitin-conjugating enzyme [Colletotrichum kahawae]|uniref:Ubiquitin-conjugating enzyme n=1 Tax=Colletotrichum kahawae TaxID=34407 RepID=A0AAD9Y5L2_COLKA|nr:ubiquitin-conjugating enzyme [Colletotrichum kahawae]
MPSCDPVLESFGSPSPDPIEEEQAIRYFVQRIIQHKCPNCRRKTMTDNSKDLFAYTRRMMDQTIMTAASKDPALSRLPTLINPRWSPKIACPDCATASCPCCAAKSSASISIAPESATHIWCCNGGRLFFIFALLCGPYSHPGDNSASLYQDIQVKTRSSRAGPKTTVNTAPGAGTGYGGSYSNASFKGSKQISPKNISSSLDVLPEVLAALAKAWPSKSRNSSAFDKKPPGLLLAMTRRSPLVIKIAELMQDDCIEEIMRRPKLYKSLFNLLLVWSQRTVSHLLVDGPRPEYPLEQTLLPIAFGNTGSLMHNVCSSIPKAKDKEKHKGSEKHNMLPPLVSLFPRLAVQVRFALKHHKDSDEHAQQVRCVYDRICKFAAQYEAYQKAHPSVDDATAVGKDNTPITGTHSAGEQRVEELRRRLSDSGVVEIDEKAWHREYHFADALRKTEKHTPRPGRMKRLVSELSILQTSIPEGIFVRHHSDRLDAMTFLIVGPAGTPYENWLFEFDLFCPMDYPQRPPQVFFRTSPPDRKFNPNLYINGYVCLSLLGTWGGPGWDPGSSTLLQVLVSIQAMIFSESPLWNEPNLEATLTPLHSRVYNVEVRADTTRYALAEWLRKLNSRELESSPWREVVATHFELRWREILAAVEKW